MAFNYSNNPRMNPWTYQQSKQIGASNPWSRPGSYGSLGSGAYRPSAGRTYPYQPSQPQRQVPPMGYRTGGGIRGGVTQPGMPTSPAYPSWGMGRAWGNLPGFENLGQSQAGGIMDRINLMRSEGGLPGMNWGDMQLQFMMQQNPWMQQAMFNPYGNNPYGGF